MIVHPHSSLATCRWQRCVVVFSRRFYSKVDFPPVGISSCHQMTSEHLLFAITNTFALSYLDQACSWIVYVTSGWCRKHLKSIESICADILSGFHHYLPKIYCSLGIFLQKHLIDAFTDLWSTLMNALNLKMDYNDKKAISEIFMIKQKFAMQNMRSLIWQFFDNEIERKIVLALSWYSIYSINVLVSFAFIRDLIFKTIPIMLHRRYEIHIAYEWKCSSRNFNKISLDWMYVQPNYS